VHFSLLLILHIAGGVVAVLAGIATLFFGKGSKQHRLWGNVFLVAMLCMAANAVIIAVARSQTPNMMAALMVTYLVLTARAAARRKDGQPYRFDHAAFLAAVGLVIAMLGFGLFGDFAPNEPRFMLFVFAAIVALCAAGDLRVLMNGGVAGAARIYRHLWRMTFALWIATASFFLGQAKVFPAAVRQSHVLAVPVLLVIALMFYWMVRVWRVRAYRRTAVEAAASTFEPRGV
jgi:uncharacterized membrane protein